MPNTPKLRSEELGRNGLDERQIRLNEQTIKLNEQKAATRSWLFKAGVGVTALMVVATGIAKVAVGVVQDMQSPEAVENFKNFSEAQRAERLAKQQEEAATQEQALKLEQADDAIARARQDVILQKIMSGTEMRDAVCQPYHIELKSKFNAQDELTEISTSFKYSLPNISEASKSEAVEECRVDFSLDQFIAPRGLSKLTGSAHYSQLKDMWTLCRGGYTEPDLQYTVNKDGSGGVYYQLYPKNYSFSDLEEYQKYQECMVQSLGHPLIKTGAQNIVPGNQPG